ncbi:MAG: S8 family peptidase [Vicingaceae bacterium]|nr:S8 family peptidase [Vicingaceae bacterium]
MRFLTTVIFFLFTFSSFAQVSKINFDLQVAIKKNSSTNSTITFFVKGNVAEIKNEVLRLKGKSGVSTKGFIKVELPANTIIDFSKNNFIDYIEYTIPNLQVLNDTALIQNNIIPVHSGIAPLTKKYTGKGVLFGLIDTGIDITHPDFQDSLGNTRILGLWDQTKPYDGNAFGYGSMWDSAAINLGTSTHHDPFFFKGHGSHVSGIAAGNGRAVSNYKGVAPDANIIAVGIDFNSNNSTVVDALQYIYNIADSLGMPCVVNVSLGDYRGSHDGTDAQAVIIDSLVNAKPGRAFVCAAGNAGALPFHLQHNVTSDTTFTWFKYNPSSVLGYGAVFYEIWADTSDFNNVDFAVGMNLPSGSFAKRGQTPFDNIQNRLGNVSDTIKNGSNTLAIVDTYGELQGDKYLLQIHVQEPDSNAYLFSLMTTGNGKLDVWSTNNGIMRTSEIVRTNLPLATVYPNIIHYQLPDTAQTIVSSFTCLPSVIAVGTYRNRKTYLDINLTTQVTAGTPGQIDPGSSLGPNRRGVLKPEIAATGRYMMSSVPDSTINFFMINPANHIWLAPGGKHMLKNGTSMASPVVAGVAALYFEKCPTATMTEIAQAITSSAKKDSFTGTTANTAYGNGKVDGLATLVNSNFTFSLGNDALICDGDSLLISAPFFNSYQWFNGDTTQSILLDSSAIIYLSAINQSGCTGFSDTIITTWKELPNKPIINIINNDTLIITSNQNTQWFLNNNPLAGETDTLLFVQTSGDYFVSVTDSFGCINYSDTITVTIVGVDEFLSDDIRVYPNPTSTIITIEFNQKDVYSYTLSTVLGKVVNTQKLTPNLQQIQVNMSPYKNGIYFLTLFENAGNMIKIIKIIKN